MKINIGMTYGHENQITVVKRIAKDKHLIKCSLCEKDPEMYGSGEFIFRDYNILRGIYTCGCSRLFRTSEKQREIKVRREAAGRNIQLEGWSEGVDSNGKKYLKLSCGVCSHKWATTTYFSFISQKTNCPECYKEIRSHSKYKSDEYLVATFLESGKFSTDWIFKRSEKLTRKGHRSFWNVTCPVCIKDKYVSSGLCTGVFETYSGSLQIGHLPCRCGKSYAKTLEMLEMDIKERIKDESLPYTFISWIGGYEGVQSEFKFLCGVHNIEKRTSYYNFLHNKSGCTSCALGGFDKNTKAYLYVLKVLDKESSENVFTGYGITKNIDSRMSAHNRELGKVGLVVSDSEFIVGSGDIVFSVEKMLKEKFPLLSQDIVGFKTEATSPDLFHEVVLFSKTSFNDLCKV